MISFHWGLQKCRTTMMTGNTYMHIIHIARPLITKCHVPGDSLHERSTIPVFLVDKHTFTAPNAFDTRGLGFGQCMTCCHKGPVYKKWHWSSEDVTFTTCIYKQKVLGDIPVSTKSSGIFMCCLEQTDEMAAFTSKGPVWRHLSDLSCAQLSPTTSLP